MRFLTVLIVALTLFAVPLAAQDTDSDEPGGFIVNLLEKALSGDNRYIHVTGLEGALSSHARVQQITVSDDDGVWLTINDAELEWSRLALLRRRFSVETLTAREIVVARAPTPIEQDPELPAPEAEPFSLPELPVAVNIDKLEVGRLELAEPVMGIAAELSIDGALSLADGTLDSSLAITRLDRPSDRVDLTAGYSNENSVLSLDLDVKEDAGGLMSEMLKIPDAPALALTAKGEGPLDDFTADIALASDSEDRLSGQVQLKALSDGTTPDTGPEGADERRSIGFAALLSGDLRPLMAQEYREFFGNETRLDVAGRSDGGGAMSISRLDLRSQALELAGTLDVAEGGRIRSARLDGGITPPAGDNVVLPISGPPTSIEGARLALRLDEDAGGAWRLRLDLDRLARPGLELAHGEIGAEGVLDQSSGFSITGTIDGALTGLDLKDDALNAAVGTDITLAGRFERPDAESLRLEGITVSGADYAAQISGLIDGLGSGFHMIGNAEITARDLGRFSKLAGRPLGGSMTARLSGDGTPLGGFFDVTLDASAENLKSGIAQLDPLIAGKSELSAAAARDENGLRLSRFTLDGRALSAEATANLKSRDSTASFTARLDDLGRVVSQLSGPVTISGDLAKKETTWSGTVNAKGPGESTATLTGRYGEDGTADVDFDAAFSEAHRFVPEIRGIVKARGHAESDGSLWRIATRLDGPAGSFADLTGLIENDGDADLQFNASLARIERFVPDFPGTVTAKGAATRSGSVWTVDANATGPAAISTSLSGTLDESTMQADMRADGQLQLAAANRFMTPNSVQGLARFNLALRGKPGLEALSGTVSTSGASLALPSVPTALTGIDATIQLASGRAQVTAGGTLRDGGTIRVSGPIALTPPMEANLSAQLTDLVITDHVSVESSANGQLAFRGPLLGGGTLSGVIDFGETNVNIAALSGAVGAAPIPNIRHIGEPAAARRTRDFAGLISSGNGEGGPAIGLDLQLNAHRRVFVRGRGLQAELGGAIHVGGTTRNVVPSGQIELLRGTFDILGRRLALDHGLITMQGQLQPVMDFAASSSTSEGSATLQISGPLDAPKIEVTSDPERPSEEALAMLLFGEDFTSLSPIRIAQIASSLSTLSGKGGGFMTRLREGLGLDSLDIGTDASGSGQVGVGNYISENIYTDVSVNARGETELNLNLDLTESLTAKGTADNAGETSLGLFYERDY